MRPLRLLFLMLVIVTSSTQAISDNSTTFTYQGDLREEGQPANGAFDMTFSLWDAVSSGNQVGLPQIVSGVQVTDGRFTVQLDFGAEAFDNSERWLEIEVNATTLSPRQPITRTPYAIQTRGIFVDDVGNVGIGTSEPSGKVELLAEAEHDARETILQAGVSDAPGDFLRIDNSTGNNDQFIPLLWGHHQTDAREVFTAIASTDPSQDTGSRAMMQFDAYLSDGTDFLGPILNRPLFKWTNANDPIMTLTANGNVEVSNLTANGNVGVSSSLSIGPSTSGAQLYIENDGSATPFRIFQIIGTGGSLLFRVSNDGEVFIKDSISFRGWNLDEQLPSHNMQFSYGSDIVAAIDKDTGAYIQLSDEALKKNIEPMSSVLSKITSIEPVRFHRNGQEDYSRKDYGFIAQDVQEYFPDLVHTLEDSSQGLAYSNFGVLAVKAIQEQQAIIDKQQAEITQLTTRLERLEAIIAMGGQ